MEEQNTNKCKICSLKNREINLILKSLYIKISVTQPVAVEAFKDRFYNGPFAKMINCIFKTNPFITPQSLQCAHQKLKAQFLINLKMDEKTLDLISDVILMSNIKRNFQLDTVINQIKHAPNSIPELVSARRRQQRVKARSKKDISQKKEESKVKIEGQKNEKQLLQNISSKIEHQEN